MVILTQLSDQLVTLWLTRIRVTIHHNRYGQVKTLQKQLSNMIKHNFVPNFAFSLSLFFVHCSSGTAFYGKMMTSTWFSVEIVK